ncbi:VpsP family polysaccharide biosynthesis protein [Alteromonas sp. A081]|uniref:VpsP family polysaccharide biosynthesis protein n=1 Tax=Alteromonas sp. A081 TaxID=3410269 RepID=UPI003B98020E
MRRLAQKYTASALRLVIALLALWGIVWSAQLFVAGNAYYSVKNTLEIWQNDPNKASLQKAEEALVKIDNALSYFPDNALYHQIKGQIFEWLAFVDRNAQSGYFTNANVSYRNSIHLRPNWSGSWIGLATVKWKKQQLDEQFYEYLNMAIKVGPQDAITHVFIIEYGFAMLSARDVQFVKIRQNLKQHLPLGLINPLSRKQVISAIEKYNAKPTACTWLNTYEDKGPHKVLGC